MSAKHTLSLIVKTVLLVFIFLVLYIGAAGIFLPGLTNLPADPGLIPPPFDILVFGAAHVLVLVLVIIPPTSKTIVK